MTTPPEIDNSRLEKNRDKLWEILDSSQNSFEKQLSYISAGSLGLSFILIEKILKDIYTTQYKWLLITGWCLLGATLLLNLWSHLQAYKLHYKTITEMNRQLKGIENFIPKNAENRTKIINKINWGSLLLLFLGIASILLYTSINIYNEQKSERNTSKTEPIKTIAIKSTN